MINDEKCIEIARRLELEGNSRFHVLAACSTEDSLKELCLLLQNEDVNVNLIDSDGRTPLHIAAACGNSEAVRLFLQHGADYAIRDDDLFSALDYAKNNNHDNIQIILMCAERGIESANSLPTCEESAQISNEYPCHTQSAECSPVAKCYPKSPRIIQTCKSKVNDSLVLDTPHRYFSKLRLQDVVTEDENESYTNPTTPIARKENTPRNLFNTPKVNNLSPIRRLPMNANRYNYQGSPPISPASSTTNKMTGKHLPGTIERCNVPDSHLQPLFSSTMISENDLESHQMVDYLDDKEEAFINIFNKCRAMPASQLKAMLSSRQLEFGPMCDTFTRYHYARKLADALYAEIQQKADEANYRVDEDDNFFVQRTKTFSRDLEHILSLKSDENLKEFIIDIERTDDKMQAQLLTQANFRGGNKRNCFIYAMLDPRPLRPFFERANKLTEREALAIFCESIFYIGKGVKQRPHEHLVMAAKLSKNKATGIASEPVLRVLTLWKQQMGVHIVQCYHDSIAADAHTKEAAIIDALELHNVDNSVSGSYYAFAATWLPTRKRRYGAYLLYRLMQQLQIHGDHPLYSNDVHQ